MRAQLAQQNRMSLKTLLKSIEQMSSYPSKSHLDASSTLDPRCDTDAANRNLAELVDSLKEELCFMTEKLEEEKLFRESAQA